MITLHQIQAHIKKLEEELKLLHIKSSEFYIFDRNQEVTEVSLKVCVWAMLTIILIFFFASYIFICVQDLRAEIEATVHQVKKFVGDTKETYISSQQFVPSDISREVSNFLKL